MVVTSRERERATLQPKPATHREPTPRRPTATRANPPKILNKPTANSHRKPTKHPLHRPTGNPPKPIKKKKKNHHKSTKNPT
jgi:hypothetical protein